MAQKSIRSFFAAAGAKKPTPPAPTKESLEQPQPAATKKKSGVIGSDSEDDTDSKENLPNVQNEPSHGRTESASDQPAKSTEAEKKDPTVPDAQGLDPKSRPQLRKTARKSFKRKSDPDPTPLQADNKKKLKTEVAAAATVDSPIRPASSSKKSSANENEAAAAPVVSDDDSSKDSPVKPPPKSRTKKKKAAVIDSDSDEEQMETERTKSPSPEKIKKSLSPEKSKKSPNSSSPTVSKKSTTTTSPTASKKSPTSSSPTASKKSPASSSNASPSKTPASGSKLASIFVKAEPKQTASQSQKSPAKSSSPDSKMSSSSTDVATTPKQPAKKNPFAGFLSPAGGGGGQKKDSGEGADYASRVKKTAYHPVEDCWWKRGEKTPYLALANTLLAIEETQGRLRTIEILANYFRSVMVQTPGDLLPSIYLTLNRLAPAWEGLELGIGDALLIKALANSTGRSTQQIKLDMAKTGDLGTVAEASKGSQRTMFQPASLTVAGVFAKLREIASMTGTASGTKKVEKIQALLVACRGSEARYLIRSLAGKLRIGLAEQSVLQALAHACVQTPLLQEFYPPPIHTAFKSVENNEVFKEKLASQALKLKTAYCECPTYDVMVPALLEVGIEGLSARCRLTPGIPLKPMLAFPTKGVQEVLTRFEGCKFTCEWKYDGERAQVHLLENGQIHIYSRNQENNTTKYPDVIARFPACMKEGVTSAIIDSEAVAWDRENKVIQPFQVLSTRKRKDVAEADVKVQVCLFGFDLLYLNGKSLVTLPFQERRALLHEHFNEVEDEFTFAKGVDGSTTEEIQEALEESIKDNCEGLMVKTLDHEATYEIARRSHNWLKLKKDYLEGVGDTLDLVVIGGYLGKGKRVGGYGGFLLACYEPDNEEYQSICKIGTGFSDEDFATHYAFFKDHVIDKPKSYYSFDSGHTPDHWFEPVQVWEVKCADLSISPVHKAARGIVDPAKGISLRFPRFIRIRDDKTAEDATNAEQIAEMYRNQDVVKNQQNGNGKTTSTEDDFDF